MSDKHVCPYCIQGERDRRDMCMEQSLDTYYMCTRVLGHVGIHIACGEDVHKIATWEQLEKRENKRHPLRTPQHKTFNAKLDTVLVQKRNKTQRRKTYTNMETQKPLPERKQ